MNEWNSWAVRVIKLQDRRPINRVSIIGRDKKYLLYVVYHVDSTFKEIIVADFS
jgi:hypothetical protein